MKSPFATLATVNQPARLSISSQGKHEIKKVLPTAFIGEPIKPLLEMKPLNGKEALKKEEAQVVVEPEDAPTRGKMVKSKEQEGEVKDPLKEIKKEAEGKPKKKPMIAKAVEKKVEEAKKKKKAGGKKDDSDEDYKGPEKKKKKKK